MVTTDALKERIRDLATKSQTVVDDNDTTMAEKALALDKIETDLHAAQTELADIESVEAKSANIAKAIAGAEKDDPVNTTTNVPVGLKSIGEQFTDGADFAGIAKGGHSRFSTGAVECSAPGLGQKATFTETGGGVGGIIPQFLPGVTEILFRRLVVADLFPSGSAGSPTITYLKESAVTNAAAAVAEGAAKPGSDLNLAQVTEHVKKIATSLKVTDEALEDISFLQSYVNARLMLFVKLAEEDQLLNGSGVGANLTGLLNRSGLQAAQAQSADTAPDAVYKEITKIRVNSFLEPDGMVMHPTDWQTFRLAKDANNQYYGGGPFYGEYGSGGMIGGATGNNLWGLPVVITPAIQLGVVLIGAFQQGAQILRKGGLSVEATNSNEDDFLKNLVAIRAEERLALAVYRPGAFGTTDLTDYVSA